MRSRWATGSNSVLKPPATLCVGESGVTSSGKRSSSACSSRMNVSYSASLAVG